MPTRAERKVWRSLRRRKGRDATGRFLAEGPRLLEEVLGAGGPVEAVLCEPDPEPELAGLLDRARAAGHRVETVDRRVIEEIADTVTPLGPLVVAAIPRWGWGDVPPGPILLLDGIQDPGNVGTLLRTAVALGAAGAIALEATADPWGPKAVRAGAGAGLRRPVFRADARSTIAELGRRGVAIWAAATDGEPFERGGRESRAALALGSEVHGVSREVRQAAARAVAVEMPGGMESLNVAAAGAILLDRLLAACPDESRAAGMAGNG